MENFAEIRRAYKTQMPTLAEQWNQKDAGRMCPYFYDWKFTPIEDAVWQDIRGFGLPMFPQVPALKYFVDFGNPFSKISIECDGKDWHNFEKDRARDKKLEDDGWVVFRIPGSVCKKSMIEPWELDKDDHEFNQKVYDWFTKTASGIVYAIKHKYFGGNSRWCVEHREAFEKTLRIYQSKGEF